MIRTPIRAAARAVAGCVALTTLTAANAQPCDLKITQPPVPSFECPTGTAPFSVVATSSRSISYLWQLHSSADSWTTIGHDPFPLPCGGFAFCTSPFASDTHIGVRACQGVYTYEIRALVSDGCATITSDPVTLTICRVDLNCDTLVDFSDYLEFLNRYVAGSTTVDYNGDGLVDFADYLEFLNLYDEGC